MDSAIDSFTDDLLTSVTLEELVDLFNAALTIEELDDLFANDKVELDAEDDNPFVFEYRLLEYKS